MFEKRTASAEREAIQPLQLKRSGGRPVFPRGLVVCLGTAAIFGLIGIWWGLPNTVSWDTDSSVPMTMLRGALCGFSHGWTGQHQVFHPALIALLSAPYAGYLILAGGLDVGSVTHEYPWGLQNPLASLTVFIVIGRLVSLGFFLVLVYYVYKSVSSWTTHEAGLLSAIAATTCYPLVYYAHTGNPDMTCISLAAVAIFYYARGLRTFRLCDVALFAIFAALSASAKIQILPLFVPFALVGLVPPLNNEAPSEQSRSLKHRLKIVIAGIVIFFVVFAVANNWLLNFSGFVSWVSGKISWTSTAVYDPTGLGQKSYLVDTLRAFSAALSIPVILLGAFGFVELGRSRQRLALGLVLGIVSYALFLAYVQTLFIRYLLPLMLVFVLLSGIGALSIWKRVEKARFWRRVYLVAGGIIGVMLLLRVIGMLLLLTGESRYQAEKWLARHTQPGDIIEVYDEANYLPRLPSQCVVKSLYPLQYYREPERDPHNRSGTRYKRVPPEVFTKEALMQRRPRWICLSDHPRCPEEWLAALEKASLGYTRRAQFRRSFWFMPEYHLRANPLVRIYGLDEGREYSGEPRKMTNRLGSRSQLRDSNAVASMQPGSPGGNWVRQESASRKNPPGGSLNGDAPKT